MNLIKKITHGFVVQTWDAATGKFMGQEFVAGDDVDLEDENGSPLDSESDWLPGYEPFDMIQPPGH